MRGGGASGKEIGVIGEIAVGISLRQLLESVLRPDIILMIEIEFAEMKKGLGRARHGTIFFRQIDERLLDLVLVQLFQFIGNEDAALRGRKRIVGELDDDLFIGGPARLRGR